MPRPEIDLAYQEKIADLMQNFKVSKSPVLSREIEKWALSKGWNDYPSERTVRRWMDKIRSGKVLVLSKRKAFSWPDSMGEGKEKIPWEHSRIALDCLEFYLSKDYGRPSLGLTQWFVRVSQADPQQILQQRALMAETFWGAEILDYSSGYTKPSTSVEELKLAFQTWKQKSPSIEEIAGQFGFERFVFPRKALRFVMQMPIFAEELRKTSEYKDWGMET